ncbi:MAG TPA: GAF domain-containing protein [Cytophagaceae bacterium]|nr:GAF domain-containing protein [Cytophagaceae bacterium]
MFSYQILHQNKIAHYEAEIAKLHKAIHHAAEYIAEIGKGNLDAEYNSDTKEDVLKTALLAMQVQLKNLSEAEKNQTWINIGLARFADLLRTQYQSLEEFSNAFISQLIKYLHANQGGIFILQGEDDGNPRLELSASYAYGRKKFLEKSVRIDKGLLGQAFQEKGTIYLTELPDQYTYVTSGLGEATPDSILIVPLIHNNDVLGVIELASFLKFEKHQIEFAEKIAESVATTLASIKINERTSRLLQETREQAENLKSQEEEMRQNLEELQTTQEKTEGMERELRIHKQMLERKLKEHEAESARVREYLDNFKQILIEVLDELPQKIFLKDEQGKFILVNTAVANAHDLSIEKLLNTSDFDYFSKKEAEEFRRQELDIINGGKPVVFHHEETISGKKRILKTMKRPIYLKHLDQSGGLLGIQTDVTEVKRLEEQLKEKEKELIELKKILNI